MMALTPIRRDVNGRLVPPEQDQIAVPGTQIRQAELDRLASETSLLDRVLIGAGREATAFAEGALDIGRQIGEGLGILDPGSAQTARQRTQSDFALADTGLADSTAYGLGRIAGAVGSAIPLGSVIGGTLSRAPAALIPKAPLGQLAVEGVATGAAEGALRLPSEGEDRATGALVGATGGLIGAPIAAGLGRLTNLGRVTPENQANQAFIAQAQREGIPVSAADFPDVPQAVRDLDAMSESVIGSGAIPFRARQGEAARQRAIQAIDDFSEPLGEASEETGELVQTGLQGRLNQAREESRKLYTDAFNSADSAGADVQLRNFIREARDEADSITVGTGAGESLRQDLLAYADRSADSTPVGAQQLRTQLNQEIKAADRAGEDGRAMRLITIRDALDDDIRSAFSAAGGEPLSRWNRARNFHRENVGPLKEGLLRRAIRTQEPDTIYQMFIRADPRGQSRRGGDVVLSGRALKLYEQLPPRGKSAVQTGILSDAFNEATKNAADRFNPQMFAKRLRQLEGSNKVFFEGAQGRYLRGMQNVMQHLERTAPSQAQPTTGARLLQAFTFGYGAIPARAFQRFIQSEAGQQFLISASRVDPDSDAMAALLQEAQGAITSAWANQMAEQRQ